MLSYTDQFIKNLKPSFQSWATESENDLFNRGVRRPAAFLNNEIIDILENTNESPTPTTSLIAITDERLRHSLKMRKRLEDRAIDESDVRSLIGHLANPSAVFFDSKDDRIVYVFRDGNNLGKIIVAINYNEGKGRIGNAVRTAGKVLKSNFRDPRYTLLSGKL